MSIDNYDVNKYVKAFYGSRQAHDWERVRQALDKVGNLAHRIEDAETRLALFALIRVVQDYEDCHRDTRG